MVDHVLLAICGTSISIIYHWWDLKTLQNHSNKLRGRNMNSPMSEQVGNPEVIQIFSSDYGILQKMSSLPECLFVRFGHK